MIHNGIKYQKLSWLKQYYMDPTDGIPDKSGIYYWIYWPDFDSKIITKKKLETKLTEYSSKNLQFPEILRGPYKFIAEIKEQKFDKNRSPFLGLSPSKKIRLMNYFNNRSNINSFHDFFKELCFARPFYIGKANNLRSRLVSSHFRNKSNVVPEIQKQKISESQIWIGYKLIPMNATDEMNVVFEEILSRNLKPGLSKKPN